MRTSAIATLLGAAVLSGCTSIPKSKATYHLPKADVDVTAEFTFACKGNSPTLVASTASITPVYSADSVVGELQLDDLDGWYSSASVSLEATADGRLISVNADQVGDGAAWAKAVASVVGLAFNLGAGPISFGLTGGCPSIPGGDQATLKYRGKIAWEEFSCSAPNCTTSRVELQPVDALVAPKLAAEKLGPIYVQATRGASPHGLDVRSTCSAASKSCPLTVTARRPTPWAVSLIVTEGKPKYQSRLLGEVSIPGRGDKMEIPLSRPALFGKATATVNFGPDGGVTKLVYGDSGSTPAAESASTLSTALAGISKTEEAKETAEANARAGLLKAEADVMAAEARLAKCKAAPEDCK